ETPRPPCSTRCFDPTGSPVRTYSSTTRRRISRFLGVRSIRESLICRSLAAAQAVSGRSAGLVGEERRRDAAAEEAPATGQRQPLGPGPPLGRDQALTPESLERAAIDRSVNCGEFDRFVEPQTEHHQLPQACARIDRLLLPRRSAPT